MKPDIHDAISALTPTTNFSVDNGEIDGWDLSEIQTNEIQPTKAEIDAKLIELLAEWNAQTYARNRASAFPSYGDQLDYIYHNGVAKWKTDMIDPVKTKYPKG